MRKVNNKLFLVVLLGLALMGCDKSKEKPAPSQVLARVNDTEITVHELNFVLQHQQGSTDAMKQRALDELIDQEIMVQRANALKLDRDPNVLQAIEFSKRQILAQAANDRDVGQPPEPSIAQIQAFYEKNPLLFSNRKVYTFHLFAIDTHELSPETTKALDGSHSVADTKNVLMKAGLKFNDIEQKRVPEQMDLNEISRMGAMNEGDISIVKQPQGVLASQLVSATPAPVSLQDASPMIKGYLQNQEKQQRAQDKYKALKSAAKVEYVRRFEAATPAANAQPSGATAKEDLKAGVKGLQ